MMRAVLLLWFVCTTAAWAQSPAPSPHAGATPISDRTDPEHRDERAVENPAHQELRNLRSRMQEAMNANDLDGLLEGVTDDVVFSTMNGDVVRGKDGIRGYFEKMMTGPDAIVGSLTTNFEADDLTLLYGGSLGESETAGVAFGSSKDSYVLKDGSEFQVEPRWTATMIREPDGWKVASFHYSVNMFDNPILDGVTRSLTWATAGGLVVGLGLGLLAGFWLGRRKRRS